MNPILPPSHSSNIVIDTLRRFTTAFCDRLLESKVFRISLLVLGGISAFSVMVHCALGMRKIEVSKKSKVRPEPRTTSDPKKQKAEKKSTQQGHSSAKSNKSLSDHVASGGQAEFTTRHSSKKDHTIENPLVPPNNSKLFECSEERSQLSKSLVSLTLVDGAIQDFLMEKNFKAVRAAEKMGVQIELKNPESHINEAIRSLLNKIGSGKIEEAREVVDTFGTTRYSKEKRNVLKQVFKQETQKKEKEKEKEEKIKELLTKFEDTTKKFYEESNDLEGRLSLLEQSEHTNIVGNLLRETKNLFAGSALSVINSLEKGQIVDLTDLSCHFDYLKKISGLVSAIKQQEDNSELSEEEESEAPLQT